jgi:hypothetical protein
MTTDWEPQPWSDEHIEEIRRNVDKGHGYQFGVPVMQELLATLDSRADTITALEDLVILQSEKLEEAKLVVELMYAEHAYMRTLVFENDVADEFASLINQIASRLENKPASECGMAIQGTFRVYQAFERYSSPHESIHELSELTADEYQLLLEFYELTNKGWIHYRMGKWSVYKRRDWLQLYHIWNNNRDY